MKSEVKRGVKLFELFSLVLLASLFTVNVAIAREYDLYVDADNDTGTEDGTEDHPYNTITEALAVAQADDYVLIKDGTYEEDITVPREVNVYGESKSGVIIDGGSSGTTVTLNHKAKLKKVTVKGGATGIEVPVEAGVKIEDVKVKDVEGDGIFLDGNSKTRKKDRYEREIIDCTIEDNDEKGMYIRKSQVTIEDSKVRDNGEEGIDIRKSVKATIKDNELEDNGESNIEFKIDDAKIKISDNDIKKAGASGLTAQSYQGRDGEISIFDNDVKKNDKYGLNCAIMQHKPAHGFSSQVSIWGNEFDDNDKGDIASKCGF